MEVAKLCKSLVMEIRPRLQSVNVFITLEANARDVKVNLNCDHFVIVVGGEKHTVKCGDFRILSKSLSCFSAEGNWVTFRFSTDNLKPDLGTSRFEIVAINKEGCSGCGVADVSITAGVDYDLACANCSRVFRRKVTFERVLPLPDNTETDDWFCHAHENPSRRSLVPKTSEIFYSHCFAYVNDFLLSGITSADSYLICERCLSWVGVSKPEVHKIWFNTVVFHNENTSFKSSALEDVFNVIKQVLSNSVLSSARIVLNCHSAAAHTDFILLWVLEKELKVRFQLTDTINANVAKTLFKFDKTRSDLVCRWLNDVNVTAVDVSKPMMLKLLEHLYDMNRYIPKSFSSSNDFYVSYLMMYDDNKH